MTRIDTRVPTESEEQQALFRYCQANEGRYPDLKMLVHMPNEGKRTVTNGARLRREGLKKGYPDIILDVPHGKYHGLRIELKRRKGSKKTQEQKDWIRELNKCNYASAFCYGWDEAWEFIHAYLTREKIHQSAALVEYYISRSLEEAAK